MPPNRSSFLPPDAPTVAQPGKPPDTTASPLNQVTYPVFHDDEATNTSLSHNLYQRLHAARYDTRPTTKSRQIVVNGCLIQFNDGDIKMPISKKAYTAANIEELVHDWDVGSPKVLEYRASGGQSYIIPYRYWKEIFGRSGPGGVYTKDWATFKHQYSKMKVAYRLLRGALFTYRFIGHCYCI